MDELREVWEDAHVCIERGKVHKGYLQLERVEKILVQRLPGEVGRASALTASLLRQLQRQKKLLEELFTGNFWVLLGYSWRPPGSTKDVHNAVKRAYRKLALKCHPDKNHGLGGALFQVLTEAYVFLTGESRLQWYSPKLSLSTWRESWDAEFPRQSVLQLELSTGGNGIAGNGKGAATGKKPASTPSHDINLDSLWSMHIAEIKGYIAQHCDDGNNSKAVQHAITRWDLIEVIIQLMPEACLKQYLAQTCPGKEVSLGGSELRQEVLSKLLQKQPKAEETSLKSAHKTKVRQPEGKSSHAAKEPRSVDDQKFSVEESAKRPLRGQQAYAVRSKDHFRRWERKLAGQRTRDLVQKEPESESVLSEQQSASQEMQAPSRETGGAQSCPPTPTDGASNDPSVEDVSEYYRNSARRRGLDGYDEDAFADSAFQESLRWAGARSGEGFAVEAASSANSEDADSLNGAEKDPEKSSGVGHKSGEGSYDMDLTKLEGDTKNEKSSSFQDESPREESTRTNDIAILGWGRGGFHDFEAADVADEALTQEKLLDEWEKLVGLHYGQATAKNPFGNSRIREQDFVSRLRASMPARTRSEVAGEAAAEVQREVDFWLGRSVPLD